MQTALHAGEQRLAQQLDAWREEIRREVAQHTNALREEIHGESARQASLVHTTRTEPARRREVLLWLITALLVLTCAGVFLLVFHLYF
jgi:type VI protein secretion system component VasF